jgi:hypothetical protein
MYMANEDGIELLILGRPGLAKTRSFTQSLSEGVDYMYVRGNQTAFETYRRLWAGRNLPAGNSSPLLIPIIVPQENNGIASIGDRPDTVSARTFPLRVGRGFLLKNFRGLLRFARQATLT